MTVVLLAVASLTFAQEPAAQEPAAQDAASSVDCRTDPSPPECAELVRLLEKFWAAPDVDSRAQIGSEIAALDSDFGVVYELLQAGRDYSADVETGSVKRSRRNRDGTEYLYEVVVPESYDPGYRYPVRVLLHGGVGRPAWTLDDNWAQGSRELLAGDSVLLVLPSAWRESKWWQKGQVENLAGILDAVKADYNVDENRISLWGWSDGGTGVYFNALTAPTAWASFLPFISSPGVLGNPESGADARLWVANLVNKPLFIVNGQLDPLYPAQGEEYYIGLFQQAGVELVFRAKQGYGHNVDWWPEEAEAMEGFVRAHPRRPQPERLVWETDRTDRYNRVHWLVIDELAPPPEAGEGAAGAPNEGAAGAEVPADRPGHVEVERDGNTIRVRSAGVARYTLLLSPDAFDLDQPIVLEANGSVAFRNLVPASVETLLRWAARDADRTMLYAAELPVNVGP